MPTYEFRCPTGHDFERFFKTISTAPSEVECPECGALAARQLSAGGGLVFKGSGFYLTDYGKNAHRGAAPEKKGDAAKPDAAKSDAPKAEGGKTESATPKAESKSETVKPKADGAKPKASPKPTSE